MDDIIICQSCGAEIPRSAPQGMCPRCLFSQCLPDTVPDELKAGGEGGPGKVIGRYKLLQKIGEGGFGVVYMAEQTEPLKRRVALKVIKPGMDSKEVIARFEAERQALALMDHPNIAHVYDAGTTGGGRPYFVMELVKGIPLTTYCDDQNLDTEERLNLFSDVCAAVQHAHQKGIVHRDLKPANILISLHDGKPVVKVIDFGIAKAISMELTEKTLFTAFGRMIGTPQYMSPEQAELNALDVDTRSDIYSLGVVLYELLTGATPLDPEKLRSAGYTEMQRMIREEEPAKPSTRISALRQESKSPTRTKDSELRILQSAFAKDLDWIILKALEKDRARRYDTAGTFAADVQRFLNDEEVLATPPSLGYRLGKVVRRNKAPFAAAALIALSLVVGATISIWLGVSAIRERDAKEEQRARAEASERGARDMLAVASRTDHSSARGLLEDGDPAGALAHLAQAVDYDPSNEAARRHLTNLVLQGERLPRLPVGKALEHEGEVTRARFSPDGLRIVTVEEKNAGLISGNHIATWIWDAATRKRIAGPLPPPVGGREITFSPDGRWFATESEGEAIQIRETATGRPVGAPVANEAHYRFTNFSPDGKKIVIVNPENTVRVWHIEMGAAVGTPLVHDELVQYAGLSPNGKWIITRTWVSIPGRSGYKTGPLYVWDAAVGKRIAGPIKEYWWPREAFAFSPDSKWLLVQPETSTAVQVMEIATGKMVGAPLRIGGSLTEARFSPDSKRVVTTCSDNVRVWDATTGRALSPPLRHGGRVVRARFSTDGLWLVTASEDGTARIWDATNGEPVGGVMDHYHGVTDASFSPDGRLVITASYDKTVRFWEVATGRSVGEPIVHCDLVPEFEPVFSQDGNMVVVVTHGRVAQVWDVRNGIPLSKDLPHPDRITDCAFSSDGQWLVTATVQSGIRVWDIKTGAVSATETEDSLLAVCPEDLAWDHDDQKRTFRMFKSVDHEKSGDPLYQIDEVDHWAFRADSPWIVTANKSGTAQVRETATGIPIGARIESPDGISSVRFTSDGKWIVASHHLSQISRIWEASTGRPLDAAVRFGDSGFGSHLSPERVAFEMINNQRDTSHVLTNGEHAQMLDLSTGISVSNPIPYHGSPNAFTAISSHGKRFAATMDKRTVQAWDTQTGNPVGPPIEHENPSKFAHVLAFTPDGSSLLTMAGGPWSDSAKMWDIATGTPKGKAIIPPKGKAFQPIQFQPTASFTPDGRRFLTVAIEERDPDNLEGGALLGTAQIWDIASGDQVGNPIQHADLWFASFIGDGSYLLTATDDDDGIGQVWNSETGKPTGVVIPPIDDTSVRKPVHSESVWLGAFFLSSRIMPSMDGKLVAVLADGEPVRIWETMTGNPVGEPLSETNARWATFSADKKWLVTFGHRRFRFWEVATGKPVSESMTSYWGEIPSRNFRWVVADESREAMRREVFVDLGEVEISKLLNWTPALSGFRVNPANGGLERVQLAERIKISQRIPDEERVEQNASFDQLAEWSFASRRTRKVSPNARMSIPQYLFRQMEWIAYHPGLAESDGVADRIYDLDPAFPLMRIALARDSKDKDWARKLREIDVSRLPGSCDYTDDLDPVVVCTLAAQMCRDQGDTELAREAIEKALALAPDKVEVLRVQGAILEDLELLEEAFAARSQVMKALGEEATTSDLIAAGHLAKQTDRTEEADALWKRVAARSEEHQRDSQSKKGQNRGTDHP